jgi:hypothetical protein
MRTSLISGVIAAAVFSTSAAFAENTQTVLTGVISPVLVNQGEAYVPAEEGMVLLPGDQLVAMEGGSAQVQFATGCVHEMAGNEVYRISADDACSMPAAAAVNQAAPTPPPGGGGMTTGDMLGAALTAGVVLYAGVEIADSDDDNDRPNISPE